MMGIRWERRIHSKPGLPAYSNELKKQYHLIIQIKNNYLIQKRPHSSQYNAEPQRHQEHGKIYDLDALPSLLLLFDSFQLVIALLRLLENAHQLLFEARHLPKKLSNPRNIRRRNSNCHLWRENRDMSDHLRFPPFDLGLETRKSVQC